MKNDTISLEEKPREPHLRVAVTSSCNFNCIYCKPGGEGVAEDRILMNPDEIHDIVKYAAEAGFKQVKFTGGEPLLRKDLIDIISKVRGIKEITKLGLVTNGYFLSKRAYELKKAGLDEITVSLDGANPQKCKEISGRDCFDRVIEGLYAAKKAGLPITINTVLMRSNEKELNGLIEIARKANAKLKFIDFMCVGDHEFWKETYFSPNDIMTRLEKTAEKIDISYSFGGLGSPMPTYTLKNGVSVLVKDASIGTNYNENCKLCKNYPCQDALISLRLTHNGKLKPCLIRSDNLVDILTPLRENKIDQVKEILQNFYNQFTQAKFYPNAWKKP